ncbi:YdaE family protein [Klebsiella oxytoca]|uniref:YdaE family protein n=1 Tax=Klebsiella oxytoca TaxID=571 RepID=UPI001CD03FFD|nr:YdaE family protein [Klebsiella oxytoca]
MKIKCAYHNCNKKVEEKEAIKEELFFKQGAQLKREWRDYCSKRCSECDQMAHEG